MTVVYERMRGIIVQQIKHLLTSILDLSQGTCENPFIVASRGVCAVNNFDLPVEYTVLNGFNVGQSVDSLGLIWFVL